MAVVTSSELPADREQSLALGADLHLEKPRDADGFQDLAGRLAALVGAAGREVVLTEPCARRISA